MRRAAPILLLLLLVSALAALPACGSSSSGSPDSGSNGGADASLDATAQAEAALSSLFMAWSAMDQPSAEALLPADRQGLSWGFDALERVEFGPMIPYPEGVRGYLTTGRGSATGVAPADVRCFRADVTFHYLPGHDGPSPDGETLEWMWFLERGSDGRWLVSDWGY
jgi:hypothetical protein